MKIAVMGCGVVGQGVVEIIDGKRELLAGRCGEKELSVKYILDIRDFTGTSLANRVVKDVDLIINDPEIAVVVETMGGTEPAFSYCMKALAAGKSVVTSNKELVAKKGCELFEQAREHNAAFMFEAAVCGGIPVIRTMFSSLSANTINGFAGILNGTTNFILTKMIDEKQSFDSALKEAQQRGYAEKDPTADIEGLDSCRKTCILASIAFGTHFYPEDIPTEGITKITLEDAAYAACTDSRIKLLGRAAKTADGKIFACVSPCLVKNSCMLSGTKGVNNAILIQGDSVGEIMLYGAGAGREATASAVVGDVLECARIGKNEEHYYWEQHSGAALADKGEIEGAVYIRGFAKDKKEAVVALRESFDSIELLERDNAPENELAFITNSGKYSELLETADSVKNFARACVIPVYGG